MVLRGPGFLNTQVLSECLVEDDTQTPNVAFEVVRAILANTEPLSPISFFSKIKQ